MRRERERLRTFLETLIPKWAMNVPRDVDIERGYEPPEVGVRVSTRECVSNTEPL